MWQSMDTAPKDGTRVLLWGLVGLRPVVFIGSYSSDRWWHDEVDIGRLRGWMPLPEAPAHD